jgi:hypothetical protein
MADTDIELPRPIEQRNLLRELFEEEMNTGLKFFLTHALHSRW